MAEKGHMKNSTTIINQLDPGNSVSLANDQRAIQEEFSSKRQTEYVVRKSEHYSLDQPPYEEVQKQVKIKMGGTYKPYENTVVVLR